MQQKRDALMLARGWIQCGSGALKLYGSGKGLVVCLAGSFEGENATERFTQLQVMRYT